MNTIKHIVLVNLTDEITPPVDRDEKFITIIKPIFNKNGKLESNNYREYMDTIVHKNVIIYGQPSSYLTDLTIEHAQYIIIVNDPAEITKLCSDEIYTTCNTFHIPQNKIPLLYYVNGSISSWRVLMFFYEFNIDFESKRVKIMIPQPETKTDDFKKINPRGKAPTVVFEDRTLYESLAILIYMYDKYNIESLVNHDKYIMIQRMIESENLIQKYEQYENWLFEKVQEIKDKINIEEIKKEIDDELLLWENYLTNSNSNSNYLMGDLFGLADIAFYPIIDYMKHRGYPFQIKFVNLEKYWNDIKNRKSAIKSKPLFW